MTQPFKIIEILEPASNSNGNYETRFYFVKIDTDTDCSLKCFWTDNPLDAKKIRVDTDKDIIKVKSLFEFIKKFLPKSVRITLKEINLELKDVVLK